MERELENLEGLWKKRDEQLSASLNLNTRLLRETVLGKAETATRGLRRRLWMEIAFDALGLLLVGSFLADHLREIRFAVPALVLHLGLIASLGSCIRQLVLLGEADYAAPVVAIQKRFAAVRVLRVRVWTWTLLLAPLAWIPLLIVGLGLLGVDAYLILTLPYLAANVLLGLVVILLGLVVSRRYASRMNGSPLIQRLSRDLAGQSLARAESFVSSLERFEKDDGPS